MYKNFSRLCPIILIGICVASAGGTACFGDGIVNDPLGSGSSGGDYYAKTGVALTVKATAVPADKPTINVEEEVRGPFFTWSYTSSTDPTPAPNGSVTITPALNNMPTGQTVTFTINSTQAMKVGVVPTCTTWYEIRPALVWLQVNKVTRSGGIVVNFSSHVLDLSATPSSAIGVWIASKFNSTTPVQLSAALNPNDIAPITKQWLDVGAGSATVIAATANIWSNAGDNRVPWAIAYDNTNTSVATGQLSMAFRAPYIVRKLVAAHEVDTPDAECGIYADFENSTNDTDPAITEAAYKFTRKWTATWTETYTGQSQKNTTDTNTTSSSVGGSAALEWKLVTITANGGVTWTTEHNQAIMTSSGFTTTGTNVQEFQLDFEFRIPPRTRWTWYEKPDISEVSGEIDQYVDSNNDGGAEEMATAPWTSHKIMGSRIKKVSRIAAP